MKLGTNKKKKNSDSFFSKNDNNSSNGIKKDYTSQSQFKTQITNNISSSKIQITTKQQIYKNNANQSTIIKPKKSAYYSGFKTPPILPKNVIKITISTSDELKKIQEDLKAGRYAGKKILLSINNTEFLIN